MFHMLSATLTVSPGGTISSMRLLAVGRPLLAAAQRAHEVRDDLTLEQVLDMVAAIAMIHGDAPYLEPILQTALDGLRPRPMWSPRRTGQTDQESRSAGRRAAASVTAMDITVHGTFLPHDGPDASLAFYRDTLDFEVRNHVAYGGRRWITVGLRRLARHVDFRASRSSLGSTRHTGSM